MNEFIRVQGSFYFPVQYIKIQVADKYAQVKLDSHPQFLRLSMGHLKGEGKSRV